MPSPTASPPPIGLNPKTREEIRGLVRLFAAELRSVSSPDYPLTATLDSLLREAISAPYEGGGDGDDESGLQLLRRAAETARGSRWERVTREIYQSATMSVVRKSS
jgi:hypothetical protein